MKTIHSTLRIFVAAVIMMTYSVIVFAGTMDSRIEESAKQSYVFKTYLKSDDIKVRSIDGVVTLSGSVLEESHRSLAQDTVAVLPGVTSVVNDLTFKGEPTAKNSDAWITTKVKTSLLFHRSVSSSTEVSVKEGVVTLRGNASSSAQKELTTEYAAGIDGVKDVKNEMVVETPDKTAQTMGEKIDDASITAQVKMTLLYHRATSAHNTLVTTTDGMVVLTGKAKNAAEKDLAAKLAGDVNGVKSVRNMIVIE
jgi:osmotically-inducible protein OsmY